MFSSTTIASSSSMPTATITAVSVTMLSSYPPSHITANVRRYVNGIEIAASVMPRRSARKRNMTSTVMMTASRRASSMLPTDSSMRSPCVSGMENAIEG